jgi:hypothetical protein
LMEEFFPWNSDGESSTCLFHVADGLLSLKPYLDFLLFEAPTSYRLSGPLQCRLPVWCILAQFTES